MVNNFHEIRNAIVDTFDDNYFYIVQCIKRRKDPGNSDMKNGQKQIFEKYVDNIEYFDANIDSWIETAKINNARLYINLNRRDYHKVGYRMIAKIANIMETGQSKSLQNVFSKVAGEKPHDPIKSWIIDIDAQDIPELYNIVNEFTAFLLLPTLNGHHLIVRPFDARSFKLRFPNIVIHKDSPTLLYYANEHESH